MTMTFSSATDRIGREINSTHAAIDEALVATSALFHSAAVARVDLDEIETALGHAALTRIHRGLGNLLSVRLDLLRAHKSLLDDYRTVVAGPDEPTCPKNNPFTSAELDNDDVAAA